MNVEKLVQNIRVLLTMKADATNECDFIVRMLFKDIY